MKRIALAIVTALLLTAAHGWALAEQKTPGQSPIPMVKGTFDPKPGTWASYKITNRKTKEVSRMRFAILDREKIDGEDTVRMEINARLADNTGAITQILAVNTPDGPGKILEVIVKPDDYSPFTVPESFFADQGGDAAEFAPISLDKVAKPVKVRLKLKDRVFYGYKVKATDTNGGKMEVVVSESVPPLGLVRATTPETNMGLTGFGNGAKTQITEEPTNFYLWLMQQVGKAMTKEGN